MTLRHMKIFNEVCKYNSISKAAENLDIAQPTVSIAIKELEEYYGVKLFDRLNRKLYITESGKDLLNHSQIIINQFELLEKNKCRDTLQHNVRIGCNVSYGTTQMPMILNEIRSNHPMIKPNVYIGSSNNIEQKLLNNELDIAIVDNLKISSHFISYMIGQEYMIPYCGEDFCSNIVKYPLSFKQFSTYPFLLREKGSGSRDTIEQTFEYYGYTIKPTIESTSSLALINAAIQNLGIIFLPQSFHIESAPLKKMIPIDLQDILFARRYFLIHHQNKYLSDSMNTCISIIKGHGLYV